VVVAVPLCVFTSMHFMNILLINFFHIDFYIWGFLCMKHYKYNYFSYLSGKNWNSGKDSCMYFI
jgi:hypothetical protein